MRNAVVALLCGLLILVALSFVACGDDDDGSPESAEQDDDDSIDDDDADDDDAAPSPLSLTIVHTNDVHAHIDSFNDYGSACDEDDLEEGTCYGGVARKATALATVRSEAENVLFLDAGDQFQGTLYYSFFKLEAITPFVDDPVYDAMTLGNHEFDDGPELLGAFLDEIDFPMVSSNVDVSGELLLAGKLTPYLTFEFAGEKVGLVGATTEETTFLSSPGDNVVFLDAQESLSDAVAELESQGVDKIIALTHLGYNRDLDIASSVDGIDLIVGGHSHTLLLPDDAQAPYPTVVESPSGNPVLVVTAYQWGRYLGRIDLTFDEQGVLDDWSGAPISLDTEVTPDTALQTEVDTLTAELSAYTEQEVGETTVDLDGSETSCRYGECNLGDLITDAMVYKTAAQGVTIGLYNSGAIRASIPAGTVTVGDVIGVLPFGNNYATLKLTGADLRAVLEHSVSRADDPENEGTGRFLQVSGLRFSWDPGAAVGERVVSAQAADGSGNFADIDDQTLYAIVTSDYLRQGGDDYTILEENAVDPYDYGSLLTDALIDYLTLFSPVNPVLDGRIAVAR